VQKDEVVLVDFMPKDIDPIIEFLEKDDDLNIVREFLFGSQNDLCPSHENVNRMLTAIQVENSCYIPLKVVIKTPYNMNISVGIVIMAKPTFGDAKC